MTDKKVKKRSEIFSCEICDYKCTRKSLYERHILTQKHKILTNTSKKVPKNNLLEWVCECGKEYKHRQSLYNHKKTCIYLNKIEKENNSLIKELIDQNKELILENKEIKNLVKDQQDTINKLIPKVGNTYNNTNIVVMLNNKFKDALNLNEFIESLTIDLEDLNLTKEKGLVKGITNAFITNLKKLDIEKRPMHCTDIKRDILYIKDDESWIKDIENKKIKNTINEIVYRQNKSINKWQDANPEYITKDEKQKEYLKLIKNSTQDLTDTQDEYKIIKNICKEVQIDK